jgi:hypothetical protein
MEADAGGPIADLLAAARSEEAAIRSRWQLDAVPQWRRVEPTMVCEVRVTNLDLSVVSHAVLSAEFTKRVSVTHYGLVRVAGQQRAKATYLGHQPRHIGTSMAMKSWSAVLRRRFSSRGRSSTEVRRRLRSRLVRVKLHKVVKPL